MIKPPIEYHINGNSWELKAPYAYVLASNGIFKVAQNKDVQASIPICLTPRLIPGLKPMKTIARLRAGKVDGGILLKILEDAAKSEAETMYSLTLNNGLISVNKPRQSGSRARVSYSPDHRSIIEIHSHPRMSAFFSATDNADEQGFKFFGVLGHIFTKPEFILRIGVYGDWMIIPPSNLFAHVGHIKEVLNENRS
jgi:hypothetical protein